MDGGRWDESTAMQKYSSEISCKHTPASSVSETIS